MVYGAMSNGRQPYVWAEEPGEHGTDPAIFGYNGVKIASNGVRRPFTWGQREERQFQTHTFTSPQTGQQPFLSNHRFTRTTDIPGVYTGTPTPLIGFIHRPESMSEPVQQQVVPTAFDLGSFGWGILTGGIIMVVIGGVAVYFAWPTIAAAFGLSKLIPKWMR